MKKVLIILLSMFLLMCCAFGLAACGGGGNDSADNPNTEQPNNPDDGDNDNEPTTPEEPKEELTSSDIYKKVNPSVVFILIDNLQGIASGTGFFIDDEGTLVTNYHVIEDGTAGVIQLSDGTQAAIGNVLGYDENLDIAVLETTAKNTTPVEIGNSSLVEVGDTVYAIGYPEATTIGFSSSTFTTGMVSMHRSIGGYTYIQSTVDITHGNSGGTLINTYGEVIGITTAGLNVGDVDYMNLSIPIQRVDTVALDDNESLLVVTKRHYPVYARFYNGSRLFTTQTLKYEQTAIEPSSSPSKTGYTFAGWYSDNALTTPFDFSTKILEDTRIYAKFDINTYTVTYNLNLGKWNGTTPDSDWTINNCGNALPVPVRVGYLFEGWTDSSGKFVDNLPASSNLGNVTYNARWIEGAEGLTINNGTVTDYNGTASSVKIPDSFRGATVTRIGNSAFSGVTNLQSITLSDNITSIGSNAFADCNINEVYAPSSCAGIVANQTRASVVVVTSGGAIGNSAFSGCTNLTSITLPNELTAIGSSAFYGCTNLADISMPNGLTTIGDSAFYGCIGLRNIALPIGLISIGNASFSSCINLTNITLPQNVTSIGSSAFSNCSNLIEINYNAVEVSDLTYSDDVFGDAGTNGGGIKVILGDTVTKIPAYLFDGCTGLTSATIGSCVTSIGDYAFRDCSNLTEICYNAIEVSDLMYTSGVFSNAGSNGNGIKVNFGDAVIKIPTWLFSYCTGLTSVTIGSGVTSIGNNAFSDCSNLAEINYNAVAASDVVSNGSDGSVFYEAGKNGNRIKVKIGDEVTKIPARLFSYCTGLTSVTIGSGVTSIGNYAFSYCSNLTEINYNAVKVTDLTETGWRFINAGTNGGGIKVIFGDTVVKIPAYLFDGCTGLTSVTIGSCVTSIGDYAFRDCSNLTEICYNAVEVSDLTYSDDVFSNAGSNGNGIKVNFGDAVIKIPAYLFNGCTGLTNVTIGSCVTSIGRSAFSGCSGLTSIEIPDSLKSIGGSAFSDCSSLKNITIPSSITSIDDYVFSGCSSLISITIPNSITSIGISAFSGCSSLKNITIPSSITSIDDYAFSECNNLENIVIPNSITEVGNNVFSGCEKLQFDQLEGVFYLGNETNPYVLVVKLEDNNIENCTLSSKTKLICQDAFKLCQKLKSITINGQKYILENPETIIEASCVHEGLIKYNIVFKDESNIEISLVIFFNRELKNHSINGVDCTTLSQNGLYSIYIEGIKEYYNATCDQNGTGYFDCSECGGRVIVQTYKPCSS